MSDQEIQTFGGGPVGPYSPDQPLAPSPADTWGVEPDYLTNREIAEYQNGQRSGGLRLFGEALPPGATPEQVEQALTEVAALIASDLMRLSHPQKHISAAIEWFKENAGKTPRQERITHRFNLYNFQSDIIAISFANHMARVGGVSQEFISNCLWLMGELAKRLDNQIGHDKPAQGSAPQTSNGDGLSTDEYNALYDYNEKMKPRTEGILRAKWGDSYHANLRMVDDYLQSLSAVEKAHFDTFLNNGLHALNDPTVILGLYGQAIGINSISRSGPALQEEIDAIQNLMVSDRKSYLKDERLQARYRYLLTLRDGR